MEYRFDLAWYDMVSEDARTEAATAIKNVLEKMAKASVPLRGGILAVLVPVDIPGALVAHGSERIIPLELKELSNQCGAKYIVILATGLFKMRQQSVEAVVAHELGHITLGHCDNRLARFVTQFAWAGSMLYFPYELAADDFAIRLGYKTATVEVLEQMASEVKSFPARFRVANRIRHAQIRKVE